SVGFRWRDLGGGIEGAVTRPSDHGRQGRGHCHRRDGEGFLFPNGLCFGPDGALYLTDSGVFIDEFAPGNKIRPDYMNVDYDGRIDVENGKVAMLDRGIKFTNGIAFGPGQRALR